MVIETIESFWKYFNKSMCPGKFVQPYFLNDWCLQMPDIKHDSTLDMDSHCIIAYKF